jgi:hypothetical protein
MQDVIHDLASIMISSTCSSLECPVCFLTLAFPFLVSSLVEVLGVKRPRGNG